MKGKQAAFGWSSTLRCAWQATPVGGLPALNPSGGPDRTDPNPACRGSGGDSIGHCSKSLET